MRKGWGVLLAGAIWTIGLSPSAAVADQYSVQLCLQPGGGAGESVDLEPIGDGGFALTRRCGAPDADVVRGVRIVGGDGATGTKGVRVTAPAGVQIEGARLYHHSVLPPGATLRAVVTRGGQESVVRTWNATAGSSSQESADGAGELLNLGDPVDSLRYEVTCTSSCDTLDARLYAVALELRDLNDPTVGVQARAAGNVIDTTIEASDSGSGVRRLRVLLDGQQVEVRDSSCSLRLSPCPANAGFTFAPSSSSMPDGTHRLRVEASDHADRQSISEADVLIDRQPPVPAGAPGIVGTPEVGATLVAAAGSWNGQSPAIAYRWERCRAGACVPIPNSDGASYVVRDEDQEHELRVVETATDGGGTAEQRSTPAPPVAPQVPVLVEPLALSGEERVGGRLQAAAGTWRNAVSLRYQWMTCAQRDGSDCVVLPGRERPFLDVERDDVGRYLVLVVTAVGPRGHSRQASAASGRIPAPPLRNLTEPSVGGLATVGGRLTAETGAWEGIGLQYEVQWLRCNSTGCLPITGAIARTYEPTSKDLGHTLVVLVTARDARGESLPMRSRPTEIVRGRSASTALAVPRVRTRVRIVSFGSYQFALTIGPTLQVLDVSRNSRVDVLCRLCARARLGRRSKVKGGSVKFRLPGDGVQIPPGGQIVVRVRRKGSIGREIVGTLSLDRSRRVSWSSPRCLARDGSLRTVECPARKPSKKKKASKGRGKSKSGKSSAPATPVETTRSAGVAVPVR